MNAPVRFARERPLLAAVVLAALFLGALSFVAVTTFIGDDHLFLAFARYAPHPLVAFVRDQHGGEVYRPLPMAVWWILGQGAGANKLPFAILSFALHLVVSLEVGALLLALRRDGASPGASPEPGSARAAVMASTLFFVAPVTQEAAFWYAASTDLFATAFGVGAIIALLRARPWLGAALFAAACWSKETALVVPLLALVALLAQQPRLTFRAMMRRIAPLLAPALMFLAARTAVLRGLGRFGDQEATLVGKLLQLASGLAHLVTGAVITSTPVALVCAGVAWGLLLVGAVRSRSWSPASSPAPSQTRRLMVLLPLLWVATALLPLLAAPWVVGARYFYLPAIGVAWFAAEVLAHTRVPVRVAVVASLAGLAVAQISARRVDVTDYQARLAAARRAVADGVAHGADTFHLAAGIKDLDLAIKEDRRFAAHESTLLVLGDVPASFVAVPEGRATALDFLRAHPPLPPSGAYHFGDRRIVGLARRGEDPTLDEVTAQFPTIRFVRLRLGPGGRVVFRDVTEALRDAAASE